MHVSRGFAGFISRFFHTHLVSADRQEASIDYGLSAVSLRPAAKSPPVAAMWATMSGTSSAARARRTAADVDLPFVDGEALAAVDGGVGGDTIACAGARRASVACDGATAFYGSS